MSGQQPSIWQNQRWRISGERGKNKLIALRHHLLAQCRCLSVRRSSTLVSSLPQCCRGHHTWTACYTVCHTKFSSCRASSPPLQRQQLCLSPVFGPCIVRPVLEYAGPVWDSCNKADSLRLERVQLSIAMTILRTDRRSTSNISVLESIG